MAAIAALLFLPSLRYGFVWDDTAVLEQLRSFRHASDLVFVPDAVPKFYYRPLVFASFLLDRAFGGEQPTWFHATNVFLHALNTWLVGWFLGALYGITPFVATAAVLLFATHPVHTESVVWIAGRSDLLASTFVLLALRAHVAGSGVGTRAAAVTSYVAALLSKETAIAALALFIATDFWQRRRSPATYYFALLSVTGLYFLLRSVNLQSALGGWERPYDVLGLVGDLVTSTGVYVVHGFIPGMVAPYMPTVPAHALYAVVGAAALTIFGVCLLRQPRSHVAFFAFWFFATLAPALTILWRTSASTLLADRYLYLPTVGACALLGVAIERLVALPRLAHAICVVLALFGVWRTWSYAPTWRDNFHFWSAAALAAPNHPTPQREVGLALLERGDLQRAEAYLQRAVAFARQPEELAMARSNLASLYRRQGNFSRAFAELEQAIAAAPHPGLFHNLGLTAMLAAEAAQRNGQTSLVAGYVLRAKTAFERALAYERDPRASRYRELWNPARTHALLGQVLFSLGDRQGARRHLETALALDPDGPTAATTRAYLQRVLPPATSPPP